MQLRKILFIDRDGTIIREPEDKQIDSLEKLQLIPYVVPALLKLKNFNYEFVLVSNQDGLGTNAFPKNHFDQANEKMLEIFESQGIFFSDIKICPHFFKDNCECRKPKIGLIKEYLLDLSWDRNHSFVIGDRQTDLQLAENMGIRGILFDENSSWLEISDQLTSYNRIAEIKRVTKETTIQGRVDLDRISDIAIDTGIGFFDHMLEQLAKHGGFNLTVKVKGDLEIDEHHTVEDTALALGESIRQALNDKLGINRYGFLLPMDETLAQIAIDLSGRPYCVFDADFTREKVGDLPTELVGHFFQSFSQALLATLHIQVRGQNNHHMIESIFKGVGRALRMAIQRQGSELPTTKGVL